MTTYTVTHRTTGTEITRYAAQQPVERDAQRNITRSVTTERDA